MEYLSNQEAFNQINAMTDEDLIEFIIQSELDIPHDVVGGKLINREMIIHNLTGINPNPNVRITYTWKGERNEQKITSKSGGCQTCGS